VEQARLEGFAAFAVANESVVLDEGVQGLLGLLDSSENAFRPHQSLGERTPAERFRLRIVEAPEPVVQDPVETSEDAVARVRPDGGLRPDGHLRKVDGNGRIIFAGTRYRVARFLAGELVLYGSTETSFASSTATPSSKLTPGAIPWRNWK